jgi:hypothetical protein
MAVSNTSPNVDNYFIGKGVVWFKADGAGSYRDMGNAPTFEFSATVEKLDHFSSRSGIRTKDRTVVLSRNASLRMILEEWTADNLAMALMGTAVSGVGGSFDINIMEETEIKGSVYFIGSNDVGAKVALNLPIVSFTPSAALSPISDEWGGMELTGDVFQDSSFLTGVRFGTANWNTTLTTPP